jgi:hypothetical protein
VWTNYIMLRDQFRILVNFGSTKFSKFFHEIFKVNYPCRVLARSLRFTEVLDNRQVKVEKLLALCTGCLYPQEISPSTHVS